MKTTAWIGLLALVPQMAAGQASKQVAVALSDDDAVIQIASDAARGVAPVLRALDTSMTVSMRVSPIAPTSAAFEVQEEAVAAGVRRLRVEEDATLSAGMVVRVDVHVRAASLGSASARELLRAAAADSDEVVVTTAPGTTSSAVRRLEEELTRAGVRRVVFGGRPRA